jgi:ABC-2 type transport system permease protein
MSTDTQTVSTSGPTAHGGGLMAAVTAITQRELAAFVFSPIAYVVGFVFLGLTGSFFLTDTLAAGSEASLRSLFERMAGLLVFALPLLTMRSIADDYASGTVETLMTAPVSDAAVVIGKFLGAFVFYAALLATTLLYVLILMSYSDPVGTVVAIGYVGMLLMGGLFLAVGIFASSCTRHQLLAAMLSIAILSVFTFLVDYGSEFAGYSWVRQVCANVNMLWHFADFAKGIVDTKSVLFFLSGIVFFLFLATKVMESRRWR